MRKGVRTPAEARRARVNGPGARSARGGSHPVRAGVARKTGRPAGPRSASQSAGSSPSGSRSTNAGRCRFRHSAVSHRSPRAVPGGIRSLRFRVDPRCQRARAPARERCAPHLSIAAQGVGRDRCRSMMGKNDSYASCSPTVDAARKRGGASPQLKSVADRSAARIVRSGYKEHLPCGVSTQSELLPAANGGRFVAPSMRSCTATRRQTRDCSFQLPVAMPRRTATSTSWLTWHLGAGMSCCGSPGLPRS